MINYVLGLSRVVCSGVSGQSNVTTIRRKRSESFKSDGFKKMVHTVKEEERSE